MPHKNEDKVSGTLFNADEVRELLERLIGEQEQHTTKKGRSNEKVAISAPPPNTIPDEQPGAVVVESKRDESSVGRRLDFPLILSVDDGDEDAPPHWNGKTKTEFQEKLAEPPAQLRNPFSVLWCALLRYWPSKEDSSRHFVRKLAWLLAAVLFLCGVGSALWDMAVSPVTNKGGYDRLTALYQSDNRDTLSGDAQDDYPKGMLESFRDLYDLNTDVRGWLTYRATGDEDFLSVDYPVMYSGDNDTYRFRDFYGNANKNGALFFDMNNTIEEDYYRNKSFVVYGNNTLSGQMFTNLSKLVGNVNYVRSASTMTLSTLFERYNYKVVAVVITDEQEESGKYFNPCRTKFPTNGDFMKYVHELRARSLFDFPVDVLPGDQLLALTTEASRSVSKLANGRLTVVARRVRSGETHGVNTEGIRNNEDVIMPSAWYANQGLELHNYYETGELPELYVTTTTGTSQSTMATTATTTTAQSTTATTVTTGTAQSSTVTTMTTGTKGAESTTKASF